MPGSVICQAPAMTHFVKSPVPAPRLLLFASCDFLIIVSSSLLTLCTQARAFFAAAHVVSVPRKILLSILSTTCFCLSPLSAHCQGLARKTERNHQAFAKRRFAAAVVRRAKARHRAAACGRDLAGQGGLPASAKGALFKWLRSVLRN